MCVCVSFCVCQTSNCLAVLVVDSPGHRSLCGGLLTHQLIFTRHSGWTGTKRSNKILVWLKHHLFVQPNTVSEIVWPFLCFIRSLWHFFYSPDVFNKPLNLSWFCLYLHFLPVLNKATYISISTFPHSLPGLPVLLYNGGFSCVAILIKVYCFWSFHIQCSSNFVYFVMVVKIKR